MNLKKQILATILSVSNGNVNARNILVDLIDKLEKGVSQGNLEVNKTSEVSDRLFSTLSTLRREIEHNGVGSERARMLIAEILSAKTSNFPDWKKALDPRGMKVGEALNILASSASVGKSMLGGLLSKEPARVKAEELGEVIYDRDEHTLTYFDKDGAPIFVVEGFTPSCIKVKTRGQK